MGSAHSQPDAQLVERGLVKGQAGEPLEMSGYDGN